MLSESTWDSREGLGHVTEDPGGGPWRREHSLSRSGGKEHEETSFLTGESRETPTARLLARWCGKVRAAVAAGVAPTEMIFNVRRINENLERRTS